jgi:hypothetical protein
MTLPPHLVQKRRMLISDDWKRPNESSPLVIFTFSGFHKVKALIGVPM